MDENWTQKVNGVPRELVLSCKAPDECSQSQRRKFESIVRSESEVVEQGLSTRIRNAQTLFFVYAGTVVAAVGALKRPVDSYRISVFRRASATQSHSRFLLELGWVVVTPDFRRSHLSRKIVDAAVAEARGVPNSRRRERTIRPCIHLCVGR